MIDQILRISAGATTDLEECPPSERVKYRVLGGLILVVAALATVACGVALSYRIDQFWIVCAMSLVWGGVIWMLERSIAVTLQGRLATSSKSRIEKGLTWLGVVVSVLWRLTLALAIGALVSEALVVWLFRGPVEKELRVDRRNEVRRLEKSFETRLDSIRALRRNLESQIDQVQQKVYDYRELRSAEVAGDSVTKRGITTTGDRFEGPVSERVGKLVSTAEGELRSIQKRLQPRIARLDSLVRSVQEEKEQRVEELRSNFSSGIVTRFEALHDVARKQPVILWARRLLFGLFLLIDTLPILTKIVIGGGPYDQHIRTETEKARIDEEVERDAAQRAVPRREEAALSKKKAKIEMDELRDVASTKLEGLQETIKTMNAELQKSWDLLEVHLQKIRGSDDVPFASKWRELFEHEAKALRDCAEGVVHAFHDGHDEDETSQNSNISKNGSKTGDPT